MVKYLKISWLVFVIMLPLSCYCQNEEEDMIERTVERTAETTESVADFSDRADVIDRLEDHPINLNNTSPAELSQIPFLTERQISNLYIYIKSFGTLYSIYELAVIDGFDTATIRKIMPLVRIGPEAQKHPLKMDDLAGAGRHQILIRAQQVLQPQAGYHADEAKLADNPNSGYLGTPLKLLYRYTYSFYDRLRIGISGEKDAGEQFFRGSQKYGMDFYSGYISLQNTGILKQLTIGSFSAGFGQGLTSGTGVSAGSVGTGGNLRRFAPGIVPSQSMNQGKYLKGLALVLKKSDCRLSLFYSSHMCDAGNLTYDTLPNGELSFSSFSLTGYHRTQKETAAKNAFRETIYGGNFNYRNSFMSLGFTAFKSRWTADLNPAFHPYNMFYLRGTGNLNAGVDFQAAIRNSFIFGELSMSYNGGTAFLMGIQMNPDPRLMFSLATREYSRTYQNLLSDALGQNSQNANERGVFCSFSAGILPGVEISGYADLFRFSWLKYRVDAPSEGSEYQVQTDYTCNGNLKMDLRVRYKTKEQNAADGSRPVKCLTAVRTFSLRWQADSKILEAMTLKTRVDIIRNQAGALNPCFGYLVSQGIGWDAVKNHIKLTLLYSLFDTDSYNERIYAYENDVLYGYSVPSYYGEGIRFMLMVKWTVVSKLEIWGRYGQTWYSDREVIGTGLEQINGNIRSDAEFQMRVRL